MLDRGATDILSVVCDELHAKVTLPKAVKVSTSTTVSPGQIALALAVMPAAGERRVVTLTVALP